MQLSDIRQEVLNHGFDPITFGTTRLNQYINDGYFLVCRRVQFFGEDQAATFTTSAGTNSYGLTIGSASTSTVTGTTEIARIRSVFDPNRQAELAEVSIRDIDRSALSVGTPLYYALNANNIVIYPTPDQAYTLEVRYWELPPALALDTDLPVLPSDWHHLLWVYACWISYEAEDDSAMGQYWMQRFQTELAEFSADARFPSTDFPTQVLGMWDSERQLSTNGWTLYSGW